MKLRLLFMLGLAQVIAPERLDAQELPPVDIRFELAETHFRGLFLNPDDAAAEDLERRRFEGRTGRALVEQFDRKLGFLGFGERDPKFRIRIVLDNELRAPSAGENLLATYFFIELIDLRPPAPEKVIAKLDEWLFRAGERYGDPIGTADDFQKEIADRLAWLVEKDRDNAVRALFRHVPIDVMVGSRVYLLVDQGVTDCVLPFSRAQLDAGSETVFLIRTVMQTANRPRLRKHWVSGTHFQDFTGRGELAQPWRTGLLAAEQVEPPAEHVSLNGLIDASGFVEVEGLFIARYEHEEAVVLPETEPTAFEARP